MPRVETHQVRPSLARTGLLLACAMGSAFLPDSALAQVSAAQSSVVWTETKTDLAVQKYGVTGRGVTVVIIDRGIDWRHPDFINSNGTTRIRALLDMTGASGCNGSGAIEYTEAQINAALAGGPAIGERDAVGHGTATAGGAAGNGRASNGLYRGFAPDADLVIVKAVSEGAPAHDGVPAEAPINGCLLYALDWADQKMTALGQPAVGLINSGTQSGPIDGTSVVSRKIDTVFGFRRGRVYVAASGDEGGAADHAGGSYGAGADTVVHFTSTSANLEYMTMWYSGAAPADITVALDDGAILGPVAAPVAPTPNACAAGSGINICSYLPGTEFYPWQSTSGDRAVVMTITGHTGPGTVRIRGKQAGGRFDLYGSIFNGYGDLLIGFTDYLVPGRLTDYASTRSAIVVGDYFAGGGLWSGSSGGPTRDGRLGIDVVGPGENGIAPLAQNSYWSTFAPGQLYIHTGATSGSAPLVVGAAALILQLRPQLTGAEVRQILRQSARSDAFTGSVPSNSWGYGKLNVLAALDAASAWPRRATAADFDGDGKTDATIYRPSNGVWYALRSGANNSTYADYQWGVSTDTPVTGDYDGDAKADVAVYRPATGTWYILLSTTNFTNYAAYQWGASTDVPVPGDYDGDGRTDAAIYRPATGIWYVLLSSTNSTTYVSYQWGVSTDLPVPADYDGDGKTDVAIYRPATGLWYILLSTTNSTNYVAYSWGVSSDVAVPADYDGDGKADVAVYRPATGVWYILKSSTNFTAYVAYPWGVNTDVPVPGDYDGDGKTDVAIYRPSTGLWYVLLSSTNFSTYVSYAWGVSTDVPVASRGR